MIRIHTLPHACLRIRTVHTHTHLRMHTVHTHTPTHMYSAHTPTHTVVNIATVTHVHVHVYLHTHLVLTYTHIRTLLRTEKATVGMVFKLTYTYIYIHVVNLRLCWAVGAIMSSVLRYDCSILFDGRNADNAEIPQQYNQCLHKQSRRCLSIIPLRCTRLHNLRACSVMP